MRQVTRAFLSGLVLLLALSACRGDARSADSTTSTSAPAVTTTSSTMPSATTQPVASDRTERFSVPVGTTGVTYQADGEPPSGPSSFAVLDDGSVVIADTMAVERGEPRLLHYDGSGGFRRVIDLAQAEVAAITDVASDGSRLAILDIHAALNRYRVLFLSPSGDVDTVVEVPDGYHFEDGLTGLAWDDRGVLLEFELGAFYARIGEGGSIEPDVTPVFDGVEVEVKSAEGRLSRVRVGDASWTVERSTDLGGATLIGLTTDGVLILVVDEVDTTGPAFEVVRRIQHYTPQGELISEDRIDPGSQHVEIMRPLELGANGQVIYLAAMPNHVEIVPLDRVGLA